MTLPTHKQILRDMNKLTALPATDPLATMRAVLARLTQDAHLDAWLEYPGYIGICGANGRNWAISTANETWGADWQSYDTRSGEAGISQSTIPSDSTDVDAITAWILALTDRAVTR